jgi:hypothetical protein
MQDLAANPTPQDLAPEGGEPVDVDSLRAELAQAKAEAAAQAEALTAAQVAGLEAHRGRILAENKGQIVAELVTGNTPEELAASVELARAAYASIAEQIRGSAPAPALPNVGQTPAGGGGGSVQPPTPPIESLTPMQKLQSYFSGNGKH